MVKFGMVKFFTQMCPVIATRSHTNTIRNHRQCLITDKGLLKPIAHSTIPRSKSRTFAEKSDDKGGPGGKEEEIESIKMPGFVHPHTRNEEGYFTQKAHQQLEELKKRLEKPTVDNREKKE